MPPDAAKLELLIEVPAPTRAAICAGLDGPTSLRRWLIYNLPCSPFILSQRGLRPQTLSLSAGGQGSRIRMGSCLNPLLPEDSQPEGLRGEACSFESIYQSLVSHLHLIYLPTLLRGRKVIQQKQGPCRPPELTSPVTWAKLLTLPVPLVSSSINWR